MRHPPAPHRSCRLSPDPDGPCGVQVSHAMEYYLTSMRWLLISVVMTLFCLYAVDVCDVAVGSTTARTVVSALLVGGAWGDGTGGEGDVTAGGN